MREHCASCNANVPSQPSAPPTPAIEPVYPFQCLCSDYFHYKGENYLIIVDRYSNWLIVNWSEHGAEGLVKILKKTFCTYRIAYKLSLDGGPQYMANVMRNLLLNWGVHHCLSSVAFPHSNTRVELGIKMCKRLLMENTGADGELDTDKFQCTMLNYRNTPDPETKVSPAMAVFGREIRDFIPVLLVKYRPHATWKETLAKRKEALRICHQRKCERLTEHTQQLHPLRIGDHVRVQNQDGQFPLKWDKTGIVIEVQQNDQYFIKIDGSGRISKRNRTFLRKFSPL